MGMFQTLAKFRDELKNTLKVLTTLDMSAITSLNLAALTTPTLTALAAVAAPALLSVTGKGLKLVTTEHVLADLSVLASVVGAFPAGAIPVGVSAKVKTAVVTSGATNTFGVGITAGDLDAFGAGILGALNTTVTEDDWTVEPSTLWAAAAQDIVLTPPGVETYVSGAVTLLVSYYQVVVPA